MLCYYIAFSFSQFIHSTLVRHSLKDKQGIKELRMLIRCQSFVMSIQISSSGLSSPCSWNKKRKSAFPSTEQILFRIQSKTSTKGICTYILNENNGGETEVVNLHKY